MSDNSSLEPRTPYTGSDEGELGPMSGDTARLIAALTQLSSFAFPFLGPLAVYLATSNKFVRAHAREALNFDIAILLYSILPVVGVAFSGVAVFGELAATGTFWSAGLVAVIGLISMALLFFVSVAYVVYPIIGVIKAANGQKYRFPLIIRILR